MVSLLRDGADCAGVQDTKPLRTRDEVVTLPWGPRPVDELVEQESRARRVRTGLWVTGRHYIDWRW